MWEEEAGVNRKPVLAIDKHRKMLAGTSFEKKCAFCAGCTGKLAEDGTMFCSNVGAAPAPVTTLQAQICNGRKPPNAAVKKKKRHRVQNRNMPLSVERS